MTGLMAVVRALRFHSADEEPLRAIPASAWRGLLCRADQARLTLPLGIRRREWLPEPVRARIEGDLARNAVRQQRLRATLGDLLPAMERRGVQVAVLKGATHWPYFCDRPQHRPQYDIDLFCPAMDAARQVAGQLGFESAPGRKDGPIDHLPVMVRRTGWRWRGDYYDPEQPPSLELHFRFWAPQTECFDVEGPERFWMRRTVRNCHGLASPALCLPDTLSYAGLHLLRHLLRGDLRLYHMYELAHFLERSAADRQFWESWAELTPRSFRAFQGIAFRLATRWFHCRLHPVAQEAVENLPRPVRAWCELFAFSPIEALDRPNKDELLLHLCLVRNGSGRRRIAARRLFPRPVRASLAGGGRPANWRFVAGRATHHAVALLSFMGSLARWWRMRGQRLPQTRIPAADTVPG